MLVLPDKDTVFWDIDDTLVVWDTWQGREDEILIFDEPRYRSINVVPHYEHITLLKKHKKMGKNPTVVWSAGGSEWAAAVVKKLGLEEYVDVIMCKPKYYYDDLHCTEFMGEHRYKTPKQRK